MFKHFLIATDGSSAAECAVSGGLSLAKSLGAKVTFVLVEATMHDEKIQRETERVLKGAAQQATRAGLVCDTLHLHDDTPYKALINAANDKGCDMIVMGSHGHGGVARALLGSVTQDVLRHAKKPVLVFT